MIGHAPSQTRPQATISAESAPAWRSLAPRLLAGTALLGVAMTCAAVLGPRLQLTISGSDQPDYAVIAGIGLVMIALSSLFLAYVSRIVGLGLAWLALAVLTNALILAGAFALTPFAFYQTTFVQGDPPTSVDFYPFLATALFCGSAAVLALLYAWQHIRVRRTLGSERAPLKRYGLLVALLILTVTLAASPLLLLGLFVVSYGFLMVAATGGLALVVALLAAITGTATMHRAGAASISLRSTAVVASVFWVALSLLLVYHVVWVVFMTVLVSLWPLKVVAPSGK